MRKYALINGSIVTQIIDLEEDQMLSYGKINDAVIDIEDQVPQPVIGWVLNGNILEKAQGNSSLEQYEQELALKKIDYGCNLSKIAISKIAARNKILKKSSAQITTLLNQLIGIKMLLETGSLGTTREACAVLKTVYTEYTDIFEYVIDQINIFERDFNL